MLKTLSEMTIKEIINLIVMVYKEASWVILTALIFNWVMYGIIEYIFTTPK